MTKASIIGAIGLVVLLAVALVTGAIGSVVVGGEQAAAVTGGGCEAALGPIEPGGGGDGSGDAGRLDAEERGIAAMIISIGKQRSLPSLGWQVALQAGMTESGLRNLNYGDRDSLGIFQMRPSQNWGTTEQLQDPPYEINKFYDVMLAVPNWQNQRPGDTAQDVERSAYPDRYNRWEAMAAYLVKNIGGIDDPTGCGPGNGGALPAPTQAAAQAIAFAKDQLGKPYVWGATGPDSFDCSGLMMRAFEAAGVKLPRTSRDQYHAGAMLPSNQAQPGDLLFWAYDPSNPTTIHHVALYLGGNQIIEAPETGVPVRIRTVKWTEREMVPQAIRPGV